MWAALNGHTPTVEALIASDVPVDAKCKAGRTALMFAASNGQTDTVNALLAGGALRQGERQSWMHCLDICSSERSHLHARPREVSRTNKFGQKQFDKPRIRGPV